MSLKLYTYINISEKDRSGIFNKLFSKIAINDTDSDNDLKVKKEQNPFFFEIHKLWLGGYSKK